MERSMELRHIRHFLAVVETGSFAGAARSLGLSQQALSASIGNLEKELSVELFHRTGMQTVLTSYGNVLLKHAQLLDGEADRAITALRQYREADVGEIRIGVGESFAGHIAPLAIDRLLKRSPQITVWITENYSQFLLEQLLEAKLDFVVGTQPAAWRQNSDLEQEFMFESSDVVFARASHPLAERKKLKIADLQGFPWIIGPNMPETYEVVCSAFLEKGLQPPKHFIYSDAIATGLGLMMRNDYLHFSTPDLLDFAVVCGLVVKLKIEKPHRIRRACIWFRKNGILSPAAALLLDEMRAASIEIRAAQKTQ
jgi:molybdate transport repressor ModE-like protein